MTRRGLLLSGGMDSFALAYSMRPEIAVTVDYGQKPALAEIEAAATICTRLDLEHEIIVVDLSELGSGDLSKQPAISMAPANDWWPYRNQALITIAAMRLVALGVTELAIATVRSDSTHRDGSAAFIRNIDEVMRNQEGGMRIIAPTVHLSTAELIRESGIPHSLLAWAHSCHTANIACGHCRGCNKHRQVVEELGYASNP